MLDLCDVLQEVSNICKVAVISNELWRLKMDIVALQDSSHLSHLLASGRETIPLSGRARWTHLRDCIYNAIMSTFGKKYSKSTNWLEAHAEKLLPLVLEKSLRVYKLLL